MCVFKAFLCRKLRTVEVPAKYITAHTCNVIVYVCACITRAVCMFMYIQKHGVYEQMHVDARGQLQVLFFNGHLLFFEMGFPSSLDFAT